MGEDELSSDGNVSANSSFEKSEDERQAPIPIPKTTNQLLERNSEGIFEGIDRVNFIQHSKQQSSIGTAKFQTTIPPNIIGSQGIGGKSNMEPFEHFSTNNSNINHLEEMPSFGLTDTNPDRESLPFLDDSQLTSELIKMGINPYIKYSKPNTGTKENHLF